MALADLFKLHDPELVATFSKKPYDAAKDRKAFTKALDAAVEQHKNNRTKVPNRMWSVANGVVKFQPKFKGEPLSIMDEDTFYVPSERFAEAVAVVKTAVEAGEFDELFSKEVAPKSTTNKKADKPAPLSTERSVKQSATRMRNTVGKSEAEIRTYLQDKGVKAEWIESAIKNLG